MVRVDLNSQASNKGAQRPTATLSPIAELRALQIQNKEEAKRNVDELTQMVTDQAKHMQAINGQLAAMQQAFATQGANMANQMAELQQHMATLLQRLPPAPGQAPAPAAPVAAAAPQLFIAGAPVPTQELGVAA